MDILDMFLNTKDKIVYTGSQIAYIPLWSKTPCISSKNWYWDIFGI